MSLLFNVFWIFWKTGIVFSFDFLIVYVLFYDFFFFLNNETSGTKRLRKKFINALNKVINAAWFHVWFYLIFKSLFAGPQFLYFKTEIWLSSHHRIIDIILLYFLVFGRCESTRPHFFPGSLTLKVWSDVFMLLESILLGTVNAKTQPNDLTWYSCALAT